jgi:hypothetical protein
MISAFEKGAVWLLLSGTAYGIRTHDFRHEKAAS